MTFLFGLFKLPSFLVMSKKRTPSEKTDGDQAPRNSNSAVVIRGQQDAKLTGITSTSATQLHDLPRNILERICIKAVALEAKDLKLAKAAWKRKADSAISRLKTVSSQWSDILSMNSCTTEVHKILDSCAPVPIHLEMLDRIPMALQGMPVAVTTTTDELYMLCHCRRGFINVYKRNILREVKHVIEIENLGVFPLAIAACSLSDCLYVLSKEETWDANSIVRITKDDEHQFDISPWISGLSVQNQYTGISVSANGNLILSRTERPDELISIYNSDGSLQHQIRLSLDLFRVSSIIPKSSGNLVLISYNYEYKRKLTEIDMDGNVVRQHQSSLLGCDVGPADGCDRILVVDKNSKMELLDSELNLLDVTLPEKEEKDDHLWAHPRYLHYDRYRNEVLMIDYTSWFGQDGTLSIFAFTADR